MFWRNSDYEKRIERLRDQYHELNQELEILQKQYKFASTSIDNNFENLYGKYSDLELKIKEVEEWQDRFDLEDQGKQGIYEVLKQIKTELKRKNTLLDNKLDDLGKKIDEVTKYTEKYEKKLTDAFKEVEEAKKAMSRVNIDRRMTQLEQNLTKLNDYINEKIKA